jgi:hypothetical protein
MLQRFTADQFKNARLEAGRMLIAGSRTADCVAAGGVHVCRIPVSSDLSAPRVHRPEFHSRDFMETLKTIRAAAGADIALAWPSVELQAALCGKKH